MLLQRIFVLMLALVTLAACGGQSTDPSDESSDQAAAENGPANEPTPHDMNGMDHDEETDEGNGTEHAGFAFGQPANASDADCTVEISAGNELVFDPADVTVSRGETVTFAITNDGDLMHDFVIGDAAAKRNTPKKWPHPRKILPRKAANTAAPMPCRYPPARPSN
jgi:plastocyanin